MFVRLGQLPWYHLPVIVYHSRYHCSIIQFH
nr:MAG TPA: hypothetical protein [Caudoviricetes sp.]